MNNQKFLELVEKRFLHVKKVLFEKNKEYGRNKEFLHNFFRASGLIGSQPLTALRGMWIKHVVSINDIIDDIEKSRPVKRELVTEKLTDNIAYLFLMDGLFDNNSLVIDDKADKALGGIHIVDDVSTSCVFKKKKHAKRGKNGRFC
jgi:hypothetical protein